MHKIALIFPYFRTHSPTEVLFPPLGAASLAAQLRLQKIETQIFDCTFSTFRQLEAGLKSYQPDLVGIYCMITLSRNTFRIAEMIRNILPNSLLVVGGPLPTLYPERFTGHFDVVFRGEVDLSFPNFSRDLFSQKNFHQTLTDLPLHTYDGLFIKKVDLLVNNPPIHYSEKDIQFFPLPDRSSFDHTTYQKVWLGANKPKTTSIMLTRGCPYSCDFCSRPVFGSVFRARHLDSVFAEIEQIRGLGYDSLWIADDNFTLNLSYLENFCNLMAGRKMTWSCLSRVTGIKPEITLLMKQAGCRRVYLGLETGSQETLQLMNKKATVEEGVMAVNFFHEAGIETAAFFIVGYPQETVASIETTFRHALTLPLDEISFNVPYPLPGSRLFEHVSGIDENKDWNKENEVTFLYSTDFDERWLRRRIGQTMRAFSEKMK